ncbi:hypothetical protein [Thermococcus thioreducens]|uniref:Uncharacterized protein n=1 Tax=Thermococcus thioreducens TaxID=277988 RepID=A0A1I0NVL4_9EURY|nr:hypothetical protein [Thermococcus thioreducens]ASJ11487.1 hypothetical protein A3L14_00665 [Thermococcus thioreducens]SEW05799.1 hypothetical protein SAMN05216170_1301 [Thermococcus thioreducens]
MGDWKTTLLLAPFIVQLVINLIFYGFPAIMFSGIVPRSLYPKIAWSLPVLIVIYFLLGMAALYYMGISPRPKRGRLLGSAYFALGALGSAWVILQTLAGMETPLLAIAFGIWLTSSIVGILSLWLLEETVPEAAAAAIIAFLGISAFISAATAQWVVTDYYIHVHTNGGMENATVVVEHPIEVSPPNLTNSS